MNAKILVGGKEYTAEITRMIIKGEQRLVLLHNCKKLTGVRHDGAPWSYRCMLPIRDYTTLSDYVLGVRRATRGNAELLSIDNGGGYRGGGDNQTPGDNDNDPWREYRDNGDDAGEAQEQPTTEGDGDDAPEQTPNNTPGDDDNNATDEPQPTPGDNDGDNTAPEQQQQQQQQPTPPAVDYNSPLRPLIDAVKAEVMADVLPAVSTMIDNAGSTGSGQTITLKNDIRNVKINPDDDPVTVSLKRNVAAGNSCYLYGPAGCGKTYAAEQLAKSLGLAYLRVEPLTSESQIFGQIDIHGRVKPADWQELYEKGGVVCFDELDAGDRDVVVKLNGLLDAPGATFESGYVKKSPNFIFVGTGNTNGGGADNMYTARDVIDISTLNRFDCHIKCDYDEAVDLAMCGGDKNKFDFARRCRNAITDCGIRAVLGYRNERSFTRALQAGEPLNLAITQNLLRGLVIDDIKAIAENVKGSGEYITALHELANEL